MGILNATYAISLAAYVFSGPLSSSLSIGVGAFMLACLATGLAAAVFSSIPGVIASPKSNICAIYAIMAGAICQYPGIAQNQVLPTFLVTIAASTCLTGLLLYAMGRLGLGNLIAYMPYPVIGGYFAGAGLLLFKGAVLTAVGPERLFAMASLSQATPWAAPLFLSIVFFVINKIFRHPAVMGALVAASVAVFYLLLFMSGTSLDQAREMNLLFDSQAGGIVFPTIFNRVFLVNTGAFVSQFGHILTILMLSAISAMLATSLIEVETESAMDRSFDLKTMGAANILSGFFGSVVSFHTALDTVMVRKLGGGNRPAAVINALFTGAALLAGPVFMPYFPKPVLLSLVMFFALVICHQWLYRTWQRLPKSDYFIVVLIVVVILFWGFFQGILLGVVVAATVFVVNYSRISVIKHELSGGVYRSKVERSSPHMRILNAKGEAIRILILQGFIFFGTADSLLCRIQQTIADKTGLDQRFIILDFRLVSNIDTSAVNSFVKLRQAAETQGVNLIFTSLNPEIQSQLSQVRFFHSRNRVCRTFQDMDHGIEWCEDEILKVHDAAEAERYVFKDFLISIFPDKKLAARFLTYMKRITLKSGEHLFYQGDPADALYLIEDGKLTVYLDLGEKKPVRLQTMGQGTVLGEMGLYTNSPRSAGAVAQEDCILFRLSVEDFQRLQTEDWEVANAFHSFIVKSMAERMVRANETLTALLS